MTEKIFYKSLYQTEFDAEVLDVIDGRGLVLDRTLFYPGGGGQPCDLGFINGLEVVNVYEHDGVIVHELKDLNINLKKVHGVIDWARRFEMMQQHLGEHIFAAVLYNKFNINTLRMRIENGAASLDLDKVVDENIIREAESEANEIIWKNIPVEDFNADIEDMTKFSRKQPPSKAGIKSVRVVKISGVDYVPCCGLHVKNTGEVGVIKFVKAEHDKNFTRVYIKCGRGAFNWLSVLVQEAHKIQIALTCGGHEIYNRVETLQNDLKEIASRNKILLEQIALMQTDKIMSKALKSQGGFIIAPEVLDYKDLKFIKDEEDIINYVKILFKELTKALGVIALLGCKINKERTFIIFGSNKCAKNIDVRKIFNEALKMIEGKGGGSGVCAQGFGSKPENLIEAVNKACELSLKLF
ncbi:MAG: hypothetical protein IJG62_03605 [Synergistaceae bacterium]|nr:hypothetical protein [Synergistaceae bacterium]